jgi:hypothetical protein
MEHQRWEGGVSSFQLPSGSYRVWLVIEEKRNHFPVEIIKEEIPGKRMTVSAWNWGITISQCGTRPSRVASLLSA